MQARRARHVLIHKIVYTPCRPLKRQLQRHGQVALKRGRREVRVQFHGAGEKVVSIEITEDEVGIGHSGMLTTKAVAGRAGIGSGTSRADLQKPEIVNGGYAPASGANLDEIDRRNRDWYPTSPLEARASSCLELLRNAEFTLLDDAQLGSRPPHIEGENIPLIKAVAIVLSRQRSGGRA
jgi:hypothetical protein